MGALDVAMLQAVTALLVIATAVAQADLCQRRDVGLSYHCPAVSCVDVFREPGQSDGFYWLKTPKAVNRAKGAIEVFCVNRPVNCGREGVWMRLAYIYTTRYTNVLCPGTLLT